MPNPYNQMLPSAFQPGAPSSGMGGMGAYNQPTYPYGGGIGAGGGFGFGGGGSPYQGFGWRGGAAGGGQAAGGGSLGPGSLDTQLNMPPAQPYQAYNPQGSPLAGDLQTLSQYGQGLLQPGSSYYQQLQDQMTRQLGAQAAAGQRSAALRGAWSGFGGGASPQMMATAGELGRAGLEASGQAAAGLALAAPQLGAQMMGQTFGPGLGLQQLGEQSSQFGAGMAEQARQFGANMGLQQQQLAAQQAAQQAQMQHQANLQQQQLQAQMAMNFGGF